MARSTGFNFIYITCRNNKQALTIGETLVKERLAACVNIIDGMKTIYRWDNKVHKDTEAVLIAKTRASHVPSVIAKVKKMHTYECPCVISLPIKDGNKEFLDWIKRETSL